MKTERKTERKKRNQSNPNLSENNKTSFHEKKPAVQRRTFGWREVVKVELEASGVEIEEGALELGALGTRGTGALMRLLLAAPLVFESLAATGLSGGEFST